MAPSTFASAAAGNSQHTTSARDLGSEWSRRTNGATQTFRRPSGAAPLNPLSQTSDGSQPARYVPPHRNGTIPETTRYSRDEMLAISKQVRDQDGGTANKLSGLFAGGWRPDMANGSSTAGWNRAEHNRDGQPGPELCWDKEGSVEPLGLVPMDDEEKELFSTSVNTLLKPAAAAKDGQQGNGIPGRKISVSGGTSTPGGVGLPSPSVTRGFGRRRETSESYPFPSTNQAASTSGPTELSRAASPPPSLQRRRTDLKDSSKADNGSDDKSTTPFGTLKRTITGPLSAGLGGESSPWSNAPQSAGFSPMGSFGNFGLTGAQGTPSEKRAGLGSGRPESRFKNLLSKDSNEEVDCSPVQRKASISSLSRVNENDSWRAQEPGPAPVPENEEDVPSGSAALAASSDLSPPQHRSELRGVGTPSRAGTQDFGFGTFGMTTDNTHSGFGSAQNFLQSRDAFHQQTPAGHRNEPMSPTDTNPYRSPEQHGVDNLVNDDAANEGHDMHSTHLPGLGGFGTHDHHQQISGLGGLGGNIGRIPGVQGPAGDRSQTSSVGPNRGFPGLGGLSQLGVPGSGGWPISQPPAFGTPNRSTAGLNAFGGGIFGSGMNELQSPSLAGLGGASLMSPQSGGGFGGSKMASMFPPAMQEQMRQGDERDHSHDRGHQQPFGGLHGIASPLGAQHEQQQQQQHFGPPGQAPPQTEQGAQQEEQAGQSAAQAPANTASNQPPAPQQRTMVMPDRMRWIYRDPQGQTQGPWTGLEMHDWYKAGFFSPELLVKKYEDPEYEPLAQLIRRIGNSREPFLVPQIGIPHGAPSTTTGPNAWAGGAPPAPGPAPTAAGAQPPFASSFPSFGTTLTADQQNALERRKQEEQYLMARQKEHLAQVQIAQRMSLSGAPGATHQSGLMPGAVGGQLHHHSSATSLHSQPSFGSMTSPSQFQPSPIQAPSAGTIGQQPGFFDSSFRAPGAAGLGAIGAGIDSLGHIREEEIPGIMDRLNLGTGRAPGSGQFGAPGQPFGHHQQQQSQGQDQHALHVQQMLHDRARLQQEQAEHDAQQQPPTGTEQTGASERLQQFQQLQGQQPGLDARFQSSMNKAQTAKPQSAQQRMASAAVAQSKAVPGPLSLTEQVEAAVSAQQSPQPQQSGSPLSFPPAPSQSPLPAPAAQRTGRQSVADQLQNESRDLSQTPSVETPSAAAPAPWAKEPAEASKGPSLREIQEMEAKKAAEIEAQQAALRKAAFEKELEAQAVAAAAAAAAAVASEHPGLPSSASWGASPATPTNAASPWAKTVQKSAGAPAAKTMAQIQKEEEARKRRLAAAAQAATTQANAMAAVTASIGGKSYANLAGKITSPPTLNTGSSAWTTVGAGGKPKTPATPTAPPGMGSRAVSSGLVPGAVPQAAVRKAPNRTTTSNSAGSVNAQEEFRKWAVAELRGDLAKGVSAEDFVATLSVLGLDVETLTEAVHSASSTIDSRHFAEEFIRRKKLADKGLIDAAAQTKSASPANAGPHANGGGWSEVAKKGPAKVETISATESNGAFRVVSKKGKAGRK